MTTIQLEQFILAPTLAVYDYVTRPARWKEWHPASLGAQEHAAESLAAGARFEEDILSAGIKRHLRWTVEEAEPGVRWAASAVMDDGSTVHLLYRFEGRNTGMNFTRTLRYHVKPLHLRIVNALFMWRKVQAESRLALSNLTRHFGGKR
ncbi:SRPBCC family protein [Nevskia soli]|uniref:SRPBCC family protein n=1 Tax=Nevskia soli TaxID=418856 RepID=UPI0004A76383|nr:SRPBCC family protein [Nevskia soli]